MLSPIVRPAARNGFSAAICMALFWCLVLPLAGVPAEAASTQEAYLVTAVDGSLSLYSLTSNNLLETINSGLSKTVTIVGPNPRLAFVAGSISLSVIDLTIGREIKRIPDITPVSMAFTTDGRWLLVADQATSSLEIFDAAGLNFVRRVSLAPAMGAGAASLGTVVVVGNKAYVTTTTGDPNRPAIAVVNLRNFTARPIAIPYGYLDYVYTPRSPNAAATPDGKYVVMGQDANGSYHLYFISTTTDKLVIDNPQDTDPYGIVIPPVTSPAYGYVVGYDMNGDLSATVLDLRNGSPTFGELLPATEVLIDQNYFYNVTGEAVNAEGTKLVVTGFNPNVSGAQPNAVVIDTATMLTNPSQAIVGNSTVANGAQTNTVSIGTITTTPPSTAPTVTGVSGTVTNDTATTIHVFGTNFASGALVRIGSMLPLQSTVHSSTDLSVTVPVNAPAAPALDVIVTNPSTTSPPAQQNQSGLLSGGLTIKVTSAFQTNYQFASRNSVDGSVAVYDTGQRAMVNIPLHPPSVGDGLNFNASGADLYAADNGFRYSPRRPGVVGVNVSSDAVTSINLGVNRGASYQAVAGSVNPATGGSVEYAWSSINGYSDIGVDMIDTNPTSPTFNTIINSFSGQINSTDILAIETGAATPNGKYVYVNYFDEQTGVYDIAIFDIVNGGPATIISTTSLGVVDAQVQMYVTPDSQSVLLQKSYANGQGVAIGVFDIGNHPKSPTLVTTIIGTPINQVGGSGPFGYYSYQVVGSRLFAFDFTNGSLVAFNFDRTHGNFSQLGVAHYQSDFYVILPVISVSPDGNLLYLAIGTRDLISVYDANKIASSQPALITNFAAFHGPSIMAVNPVLGSDLLEHRGSVESTGQSAH